MLLKAVKLVIKSCYYKSCVIVRDVIIRDVTEDEFSVRVTKITSRIGAS